MDASVPPGVLRFWWAAHRTSGSPPPHSFPKSRFDPIPHLHELLHIDVPADIIKVTLGEALGIEAPPIRRVVQVAHLVERWGPSDMNGQLHPSRRFGDRRAVHVVEHRNRADHRAHTKSNPMPSGIPARWVTSAGFTTTQDGSFSGYSQLSRYDRGLVLYKRSAFKRGYSREDIERIVLTPFTVREVISSTGDPAIAVQGYTSEAELIEIHYQRHEVTDDPIVFHVQPVSRGATRRLRPCR